MIQIGLFVWILEDQLLIFVFSLEIPILKSSTEVEYSTMVSTTCELSWLLILLKDFRVLQPQPAFVFFDNKDVLYIVVNPIFHEKTKHIEIDYHIGRENLQANIIKTLHVSSQHQLSDIFTIALGSSQFHILLGKKGVLNIYSLS